MRRQHGGAGDDGARRVVPDGGGRRGRHARGAGGRLPAGGGHAAGQVQRDAAGGRGAGVRPAGPAGRDARRRLPPRPRRILLPHELMIRWDR